MIASEFLLAFSLLTPLTCMKEVTTLFVGAVS
jgi:hypothetical protein